MNELTPDNNRKINNPPLATGKMVDAADAASLLAYRPDGFFLGAAPNGQLLSEPELCDAMTLVCGGTRGDKGVYASNTLFTRTSSLFYYSTKAADVPKIAPRRGNGDQYCDGMGQAVYCFDGSGIVDRDLCEGVEFVAINPITGIGGHIDPTRPDAAKRAQRLAICLVPLSDDNYFKQACRALLTALILYVAFAEIFKGRRDLGSVYDLACEGDLATWEAMRKLGLLATNKKGQITQTPFDVLWDGMKSCKAYGGEVAKQGRMYSDMKSTGDGGQFLGVRGEATTSLSFLIDPILRSSLTGDSSDLSGLKTDPNGQSWFIILDSEQAKGAGASAIRMIWAMFEVAVKQPVPHATGQVCTAWIDEFASLGYMDTILTNLAELASWCRCTFLVQTLAQIEEVYKKTGLNIFYSGIMCTIFLDVRDNFTASEIQKMAGDQEILTIDRSASRAKGKTTSTSDNYSDTEGTGKGTNSNAGFNESTNKGHNYNGSLLSPMTPLFLKSIWGTAIGQSLGYSKSSGDNESSNESHTLGGGTGESESDTETCSLSERRHIRPLLPINKIMNRYGKVNLEGHRLALVHIVGLGFLEVIRVRFWEHEVFYRTYGKDPGFDFVQAPKPQWAIEQEREAEREVRRIERIEFECSPAGQAQREKKIKADREELNELLEREDMSLLANGLLAVSAVSVAAFLVLGLLPMVALCAIGGRVSWKFRQTLIKRESRIQSLRYRIAESERKERR